MKQPRTESRFNGEPFSGRRVDDRPEEPRKMFSLSGWPVYIFPLAVLGLYIIASVWIILQFHPATLGGKVYITGSVAVLFLLSLYFLFQQRRVIRELQQHKRAHAERNQLEERLIHSHKMEAVGQLAGGVAHDFNNILTAIHGNAELLKLTNSDFSESDDWVQSVDQIIQATSRAADLTKQLLAFARKGTLVSVPVNVNRIITEVVQLLNPGIDDRTDIRLELHAKPDTIQTDPAQLKNAILNLGFNARDALLDGGEITFATRNVAFHEDHGKRYGDLAAGDYLEIRVCDTGVGMDAETRIRVFEPFFTTKETGKGTGMGLASVYGFVKSHHGDIQVSSEPGKGATFHVLLPVGPPDEPDAVSAEQTLSTKTGHVLLVDDEEIVRNFAATVIRNLGHTVVICADGAEAVHYYRKNHHKVDVVILDMVMPVLDGAEAFRQMKQIRPDGRILLSSGFSRDAIVNRLIREGALGFISKPFKIEDLSDIVSRHVLTAGENDSRE